MAQTAKNRLSTIGKGEEEIMSKHITTVIPNYFMSGRHENNVSHM